MEKALWNKIESIVDEALTMSGEEQNTYVTKKCNNDEILMGHVTQLLKEIQEADEIDFLEFKSESFRKISSSGQIRQSEYIKGDHVGAYQIECIIASGGMGSVYKAKRADSTFEMDVAIKFIKTHNYTSETLRRFELEQKILAKLQHPNIARMLDGGITEDGVPYIILEFVNGTPIDEYCSMNNCSIKERISLFKQVLQAVRYAHENLVIHRDLKPGNIFVDESGKVKILDFGISKLLEDESETAITHTQTGTRLLTPRYAAPEQIRQENITTATDTYALGVVFYELITGAAVFELNGASRYEMEQAVINQEPLKPSQKVKAAVGKKKLAGDLDAIALKAIRKEPEQRYRVANEFLEDLDDYERGLPVSAREGSLQYRAQKFIVRHKQGVVVALGILLLIFGFAGFYTWQITVERDVAQFQAQKAEEISGFLVGLFEANDPEFSRGDTLTALQVLEMGKTQISELDNQPAVKARMLEVLGNIYELLNQTEEADSLLRHSLKMKKDLYNKSDPELASIYYSLADVKNIRGEYELAAGLLDTGITYQRRIHGNESKEVARGLKMLSKSLWERGKIDSAETIINEAHTIFKTLKDTASEDYLGVLMELGDVNEASGNIEKTEQVWRQSLQLSQELFEAPHPMIINNINGLADVLVWTQDFAEAESLFIEGLKMSKKIYGNTHRNPATIMNNLAGVYFYTEEYKKADTLFSESYNIYKKTFGESHPQTLSILYNIAAIKLRLGEYKIAEKSYKKIIDLDISTFGENHPNVAYDYEALATLYQEQKKYQQALINFDKTLEIRRTVFKNQYHPLIGRALNSIGEVLIETGRYPKAEKMLDEALICFVHTYGEDHDRVRRAANNYARVMELQNKKVSPDSLIAKAQQLVK